MKVGSLISMLELIAKKHGPDVDVAIQNAAITVDGVNVDRIYHQEWLPMIQRNLGIMDRIKSEAHNRRLEVVRMLENGMTRKDIAAALGVSPSTVRHLYETHLRKLKEAEWRKK